MSDDLWDDIHKQWHRADEMRRVDRETATERLCLEADHLAHRIDMAQGESGGRAQWHQAMHAWRDQKTAALESIRAYPIAAIRDAWYACLEKIEWSCSSAGRELQSLLARVEPFLGTAPLLQEESLIRVIAKGDAAREMYARDDLNLRKEIALRLQDLLATQQAIDAV